MSKKLHGLGKPNLLLAIQLSEPDKSSVNTVTLRYARKPLEETGDLAKPTTTMRLLTRKIEKLEDRSMATYPKGVLISGEPNHQSGGQLKAAEVASNLFQSKLDNRHLRPRFVASQKAEQGRKTKRGFRPVVTPAGSDKSLLCTFAG